MKNPSTYKQNSVLLRYTLLKFWQPESGRPITKNEAATLIDMLFRWSDLLKTKKIDESIELKEKIVDFVRTWFPDWDGDSLKVRFSRKKTGKDNYEKPKDYTPEGNGKNDNPHNGDNEDKSGKDNQGDGDGKDNDEGKAQKQGDNPEQGDDDGDKDNRQGDKDKDNGDNEKQDGGDGGKKKQQKQKQKKQDDNPPAPPEKKMDKTEERIRRKIKCGARNIFLHGPSGTGKTTICKLLAAHLTNEQYLGHIWPITILSCNAGTSPSEIRGFFFPERRHSIITQALSLPGIIVTDEITTLDPSVAAVLNALLANGEIETSMGLVKRHPDCIIIATANTTGDGANRQYIGNNQLDAATLDRFVGSYIKVDYSKEYESQYDTDACKFVWSIRKVIKDNELRRIASTRAIQDAHAAIRHGIDTMQWKADILAQWTPEERALVPGWDDVRERQYFGSDED